MDFRGMKRRDLQTLCKKHGIPGNLKNNEMTSRLASIFEKDIATEKKISPEDSVKAYGIKDTVVVSGEAKKVKFSPEAEVFEFTRSVKKRQRKTLRTRSKEPAQDLQQDGIELRRSTRSVAKEIEITIAGSSETGSNTRKGTFETEKECSRSDVTHKVTRRSKRIGSSGSAQEDSEVTELMAPDQFKDKDISKGMSGNELQMEITNQDGFKLEKVGRRSTRLTSTIAKSCVEGETSKAEMLLPAKRSKRLVEADNKEVELVKNNVKEVSMEFEVQKTGKYHRKDMQDDLKIEKVPRRSKRFVNDFDVQTNTQEKDVKDDHKAEKVPRRSKRFLNDFDVQTDTQEKDVQDDHKVVKVPRQSKRLVNDFDVQTNTQEKDVQDDPIVEKVPRRSKRFVNDLDLQTNAQDQRRSTRLKTNAAEPSTRGGESDGRPLWSAKESKEERKAKQSKGSVAVNSLEGEPVKNKTKEASTDCEVQTTENYRTTKVHDVSKVEKVTRRSKRLGNNVDVPLVDENVKAVKRDDLEVKKAPRQSKQLEKSVRELPVDGQVQKGDKQPKSSFRNDGEGKKLLRRSKRVALDNIPDQEISNSSVKCSVIDYGKDGASADNVKKTNANDEMQVHVRFTRNSSRHVSSKSPIVVEGNLAEKNTDETLDSVVKSSKSVSRRKKRDRSAEAGLNTGIDTETASTHINLTPRKLLDISTEFEQEEAGGTNVEARGSSKKMKTVDQECVKGKPQGLVEDIPSSSETKTTEYVMIAENVLDSTLEKSVDSSQRTNTQESNSELMEGEREKKLEQDTILMAGVEEEKEEVASRFVLLIERLSPASVQLAEAELVLPTDHLHVEDIASTAIAEEITKTKDETLVCTPRSEQKEHSSVAKLTKVEDACWKETHSSKDDEKSSSEANVQAADLHGKFSECNTENSSAEEEMKISKVDCMSVGDSGNLTPEKLLDEYPLLELEEADGANVEVRESSKKMKTVYQEFVKDKPQGMAEDSPSTSEIKATEPVIISENVLDSTPKVSVDISLVRNTQELNSELMEEEREEKHEQYTVLLGTTKKDTEETSSLSVSLVEGSEIKTCPDSRNTGGYLSLETNPPPASVQLAMSKPEVELGVPTGSILVKGIVSTVIAEENTKTKDDTFICTPRSELEQNSSVAKLAKAEAILEKSAECCKEIHSSEDDEKGSLEKDLQAENVYENFTNYNTENHIAEEDMEISKVGCTLSCVNLTPEKLLDVCTQLEPEEEGDPNVEARGSSKKMKTVNQSCAKDKPRGMAEDSHVMISGNVLDSTPKSSVDISPRRNTQELNSELMKGEREEKHEQDTILMDVTEDKKEASSLSVVLIEHSEVSSPETKLFVETTPPPASIHFAVSNPEAELGMSTGHILVKDIASAITAKEDNKTKEEVLGSIPKSELKEHSFVAKLAETEAVLENFPEAELFVETPPPPASIHLAVSNPEAELSMPTGHILVKDIVSAVTAMEDNKTEEILSSIPRSEMKEHSFVAKLAEAEVLENCPESELFVETTPPPASIHLAVSNPEAELSMPTGHILVKDIASAVTAKEDKKTKEEILSSIPRSEMKEHSFVAKLAEAEVILENSVECWKEINSSKDDEKSSLEKEILASNLHGNFSEYNTENSSAEEQAEISKVGHCVNLETLDEVKDDNLEKSERTISSDRGYKLNALETSRWSTGFSSLSPEEKNVSECFEEDEMKPVSQPIPIYKASSGDLDKSAVFTTPERNLMLMEQLSEKGKTRAAESVTRQNDEAVESQAIAFTTPEQVLFLGDSGLDEAGKEEEHTTADFPDESDVHNTTDRCSMLGGSRQNEAANEEESIVVELDGESDIATSPVKRFSVGDFKGDGIVRNEENKTVELHYKSGTCTSSDKHASVGNFVSDGAENSEGNKAMEIFKESVVHTGLERFELSGCFGQDKPREGDEESGLSTELHKDQPLADSELDEAEWQEINGVNKSGVLTNQERQLFYGDSEQKKAVETGEKLASEFLDESAVPNIPETHPFPEDSGLDEAVKREGSKVVELRADCTIFTSAKKHLLLETNEEMKGDNITAKSHVVSDVFTAAESQSLMGDFEPNEAGEKYREKKDVELLGESSIFTNLERHLLSEDSELEGPRKIRENKVAACEESFNFPSPERRQLLGNSEPHNAGKQKQKEVEYEDEFAFSSMLESRLLLGVSGNIGKSNLSHHSSSSKFNLKENSVVRGGHVAALDFKENTIVDSTGRIASKVSFNHGFNAGQETAGAKFMPKGIQAENVEGTPKQSIGYSPHFDLFHFDLEEAEKILEAETSLEAERNVSPSPYVLALQAKGNSETVGETSNHLEVAGTCSMVFEKFGPFTDIQKQINDALEEFAMADELIEAKVTRNTEKGCQGNILLESSGGSYVSGKTCDLAETEDEHLPIATAFDSILTEKAISPTPDESTVQYNMNEKEIAAYEEMVRREATPSPEETLNQSSESRKEPLNVDESGMLSEKQQEPNLIYRTQVKPIKHDMKENALNSKIVHNLNVTAPRTSKRQPLQDLRKN